MEILVLGGTGFLGRYIVEELAQREHNVTVLTRNPEKMKVFDCKVAHINGDLLYYNEIDFSNFTHIINCSGELTNEERMQTLHVDCIKGILQRLKQVNPSIHWLQISSVGVYGKVHSGVVRENSPFAPVGTYEITKAESEKVVKNFCNENGINYTIIRPSNVFGIGMPNQSLAQLISIIKKRLFFYIGNAKQNVVMNYVPVENVAKIVALCVESPNARNQDYIISDQIFLNDFVDIICQELNLNNRFLRIPKCIVKILALIPGIPLTQGRIDALTIQVSYSTEKAKKELLFYVDTDLDLRLKYYIKSVINNDGKLLKDLVA